MMPAGNDRRSPPAPRGQLAAASRGVETVAELGIVDVEEQAGLAVKPGRLLECRSPAQPAALLLAEEPLDGVADRRSCWCR